MILKNIVALFITKLYYKKPILKIYYRYEIIQKNLNSTYNLFNSAKNINNSEYYYDTYEHIFKKKINNMYDGIDMTKNETEDLNSIYNISDSFYKKKILDILTNNMISNITKLDHIEDYNNLFNDEKGYNMYGGGLFRNWTL
jgi:hypothetical protein